MSYNSTPISFWQRVGLWIRRLPGCRYLPWPYVIVGVTDAADEIPDKIPPRTVVVVQAGYRRTWVAFDCPKHRSERIMLNLSTRRRPYWRIDQEPRLTLHPSVDAVHVGDRCHFWMRHGQPNWVKEAIKNTERNT